jgi:hypothetical protein
MDIGSDRGDFDVAMCEAGLRSERDRRLDDTTAVSLFMSGTDRRFSMLAVDLEMSRNGASNAAG